MRAEISIAMIRSAARDVGCSELLARRATLGMPVRDGLRERLVEALVARGADREFLNVLATVGRRATPEIPATRAGRAE